MEHVAMRCRTFLFTLALVTATPVILDSGQEARAQGADSLSIPLSSTAWAMQFKIGTNFRLKPFEGGTFAFKKHLSPSSAWQVGVRTGASTSTSKRTGSAVDTESGSRVDYSISLRGRYLSYPLLGKQDRSGIQLFTGAGPLVRFSKERKEADDETILEETGVDIGISSTVGAEWFFHSRVSAHAQYVLDLEFSRFVRDRKEENKIEVTEAGLRSVGVRFGLSVYF